VDEIEATCPVFLATSVEPCWKCDQPQQVTAIALKIFTADGDSIGDGQDLFFLTNIESMPEDVFEFVSSRNARYKKHYSYTADSTYFANTCECGANFGDFYLYMEPDGAFFPTTDSAAKKIAIEAMPFSGKLNFVGAHCNASKSIKAAV
jgi:hypothetical protein